MPSDDLEEQSMHSVTSEVHGLVTGGNPNEESEIKNRHRAKRSLQFALFFSIIFMIAEGVGGYLANSIAVLSDAAHVATDVAALSISLFAIHASQKPKCNKYSYGWHRIEIIGSFTSLLTIWFLTSVIVYEGVVRLKKYVHCAKLSQEAADLECDSVDGRLMVLLGSLGLILNFIIAGILSCGNAQVMHSHSHGGDGKCPSQAKEGINANSHGSHSGHGHSHSHSHSHSHGHAHASNTASQSETKSKIGLNSEGGFFTAREGENVNVKSAMIHALGDCIQSLGVIIAALTIWLGNNHAHGKPDVKGSWFNIADPIVSFLFAIVTLWTTAGMFKQVCRVLMEAAPQSVNSDRLRSDLEDHFGDGNVHDLHIWSLTLDKHALSAHIVSDCPKALKNAKLICTMHKVTHTTIQIDSSNDGADLCQSPLCSTRRSF